MLETKKKKKAVSCGEVGYPTKKISSRSKSVFLVVADDFGLLWYRLPPCRFGDETRLVSNKCKSVIVIG